MREKFDYTNERVIWCLFIHALLCGFMKVFIWIEEGQKENIALRFLSKRIYKCEEYVSLILLKRSIVKSVEYGKVECGWMGGSDSRRWEGARVGGERRRVLLGENRRASDRYKGDSFKCIVVRRCFV